MAEPVPAPLESRYGRLVAQLLWNRGHSDASSAEALFDARLDSLSSPFLLKNMELAATRVAQAVRDGERIAIYADYDIDGMSGLAILVSFLEACGAEGVIPYQPDRLNEGYGVHPAAMRSLAEQGVKVIVTVDTGIAALDAAVEAERLGITLIVTDHHQQIGELPRGAIVVNPNQKEDSSGLGYLSGAGMAFYLAIALRSKLREMNHFTPTRPQPDLREWLDLLVLGTIADHVELTGDNRALVRAGLKQLAKSKRTGLARLRDEVLARPEISARDVAFSLTPKLNAASRMGHAELSTELLLTRDPARAEELVGRILELNQTRSEVQAKIFEEAVAQLEDARGHVLLACGEWHEGVLGIVAAKLVEHFGKPSVVLTRLSHGENLLRGSMRTTPDVSCVATLAASRDLLDRFGGHEMAAGMQMKAEHLEEFRRRLSEGLGTERPAGDEEPAREILFDGKLPLADLHPMRVETLENLGPWGQGNPEPLFLAEGIPLENLRILKQSHAKLTLPEGQEIIGFFKAKEIESIRGEGHQKIDALLRPEINRFRGVETVQLKLEHVRPHQSIDPRP